jgi:Zn-dependent hydrolases, including glyoxylases
MSVDKTLKIALSDYDVKEIAPKIYKINEYNLSTMFVIVGTERALAIDCGVGVGDYKAVIERLTEGKPYDLVLSHAHVDHAGGRGQFEKLYVSKRDECIIKDASLGYRKFYIIIMRYLMMFKCITFKKAVMEKVVKEPEVVTIDEGYVFDLGNKQIEVIASPGHTLGCLCFLDRADKILFSGDTFNPLMLMFLPHATTIEEYLTTTKRVLDIDGYDVLWPSHLAEFLTREDAAAISATAEKIVSHHKCNFPLPSIWIGSKAKRSIIFRPDKVRLKRKDRLKQEVNN